MTIGLVVGICTLFFMVLHFTMTIGYNSYNLSKQNKANKQNQIAQLQTQINQLTAMLQNGTANVSK